MVFNDLHLHVFYYNQPSNPLWIKVSERCDGMYMYIHIGYNLDKSMVKDNMQSALDEMSTKDNSNLPGKMFSWCLDVMDTAELFDAKDVQLFTSLVIKHCNDPSILEKVQPSSAKEVVR